MIEVLFDSGELAFGELQGNFDGGVTMNHFEKRLVMPDCLCRVVRVFDSPQVACLVLSTVPGNHATVRFQTNPPRAVPVPNRQGTDLSKILRSKLEPSVHLSSSKNGSTILWLLCDPVFNHNDSKALKFER
jgi:hypothetical protein